MVHAVPLAVMADGLAVMVGASGGTSAAMSADCFHADASEPRTERTR